MPHSLVPPETVTELVPLWPAIVDNTSPGHQEHTLTGCISSCGTKGTLCGGPWIRVYQTATGQLYSELWFGGTHEQALVGPFVELVRGHASYIVVALQGSSGGSLLCVCQPFNGHVVRAIQLPAPATHLALVSAEGLGSLSGGCVAVGTADRSLLLLDLCLDSDRHRSHERKPAGLLHLDSAFCDRQLGFPSGAGIHGCVHLCSLDDLVDTNGMSMMEEEVELTCLQWFPQLSCLGIGLNSGHVHLWNVRTASSRMVVTPATDLPVVALALQEPENDPRCCCYLWVAHGCTVSASAGTFVTTSATSFSSATLHTLSFQKKKPGRDGHHRYKGLISSRLVFEYLLVPEMVPGMEALGRSQAPLDDGETLGSRVLSFRTAPSPSIACPASEAPSSPSSITRTGYERVEDLLLLSWQLMRGGRVLGTYLSVFDLNQWYRAQMPHAFRGSSHQLCSYIGLFSLGEAAAKCGSHTILDIWVDPSSIKRSCLLDPMIEQTHFPSSLAFRCICMTAEGAVSASYLGLQQQLLHNMDVEGPTCLAKASELCICFSFAGLISIDHRSPSLWHANTAAAQQVLLDLALDHRLVGFLVNCLTGHTQQVGDPTAEPLLPFVLEWTWKKVKKVKSSLDTLYGPLFDCSGQDGATTGQRMLAHLEELYILHRLLGHACGMAIAKRELVTLWHDVAGLLSGHLSVLLFLLQSGVLPDHRVGEGALAYPYTALHSWCQEARSNLGRKLLVDVLVEAALGDAADPSGPVRVSYPPLSIQKATDVYLMRGLKPWAPHVITYYLLLDISAIIFHDYPTVKQKLKYFPSAFHLGTDVQSLVEGIWHLDHGNYEEGVENLLRAQLLASAGLRPLVDALWGPAVRLLLHCQQPPLALRCLDYLQGASTPDQMTLQLDVLLANCRVIDALELVRKHGHLSSLEQLLGCIVTLARKSKVREAHDQLELLLQVPLTPAEEEQLVSFFCELADPTWMCHVVLHFLQCGRPHAVLPLTSCLQELFQEGRTQRAYPIEVRQKVSGTLELVQSFMRLMPLPASQLNAAARRRNQSGVPVQYLGTVPTRVPHRGTTPRLSTRMAAVRATMDAVEASKPPMMPSTPADRVAGSESWAPTSTPAADSSRYTPRSRLEEEAASILCTPPITLWEGLPRRNTTFTSQPSTSTPASILKRRPVDLPSVVATPVVPRRGSREDDSGTCPTPTELGESVHPTPDPSVRRLRFAMSDSNSSEGSPDLDTTGQSQGDSSLMSPSEEWAASVEEASHSKGPEGSSDRSSQFLTPSGSDSEDSATDLQDSSTAEPVASAQPEQPVTSLQPTSTDQDTEEHEALEPPGGRTPSPVRRAQLPEFLIQEATRCLHSPTATDLTGPVQPVAKESPPQPAREAAVLAESEEPSDEEDLNGTPLMDSSEEAVPRSESPPQCPPQEDGVSRGCVVGPPKREEEEIPSSATAAQFGNAQTSAAHVGPAHFASIEVSTAHFGPTQISTARFSTLEVSSAYFQTPAEEPTPLCDDDGTELVEDPPSRACSQASTVSLRVPEFAVGEEEQTAAGQEGEPVIEQHTIIISASEASESEKEEEEEEDVVILSDTSSEALLELQPTHVESPGASWSRSSGTSTRETEAPLAELRNMQPSPLTEPLEMARGPSAGLMTPAGADVEHVQVEQSLPSDAFCPLEGGDLTPSSDSCHPEDAPITPARDTHFDEDEPVPIAETFSFVPALDQSPLIEAGGGVPLATEKDLSGAGSIYRPVVLVAPLDHSPPPADARRVQDMPPHLSPPAASSKQSPPKRGLRKTGRDESDSEKAEKTPEHSGEPLWWQNIVASSYNLRERRKSTSDEKERGLPTVTPPRASRRKSGSVPPPHRSPVTPTKTRRSQEPKESPTSMASPARKARAASEEPVSAHSRAKKTSRGPSRGTTHKGTGTVSPKQATPSPGLKLEMPNPKGRSETKTTLASAQSTGKRLSTPSPRKKSKTPSPRRAGVSRGQSATPSPRRQPPASAAKVCKESKSPANQETTQEVRGQSRTSRARQKAPVTRSPQKQTAKTPSPEKEPRVRSPAKDKTLSPEKKTRARQRSSSASVQEQLRIPSPIKDETPLSKKRGRNAGSSSSARAVQEPALAELRHSSHLAPDKKEAPKEQVSPKRSSRKRTARTPSPSRGSPIMSSPAEEKAPSPAKKFTSLRLRSSSADVKEHSPELGSSKDDVPGKKADGRTSRTPRRTPVKMPLPTSARRSSRLTPDRQQDAEGRTLTPSRLTGSRRRSSSAASTQHALETIAEDDSAGSDAETSPRRGNRSQSAKPNQSTPQKRVPLRRSRRVSGSTALDTIAEVPGAEAELASAVPRSRGSAKRKAGEGTEPSGRGGKSPPPEEEPASRKRAKKPADAEGFEVFESKKPTDKGSKTTNPAAGLFSPPVTRHRQMQKVEGKSSTSARSSQPMSKEDTPKTKQQRRVVIVPVLSRTPNTGRRAAASSTKFPRTPRQPVVRYKLKLKQPTVPVYRATSSPSTRTSRTKRTKEDE